MSVFPLLDVSCNTSCGPTIHVAGKVGGQATLPVKLEEEVNEIIWIISDGRRLNHFAITKPNEPVDIRVDQYEGRLCSETDASLTLTDLTNQDQRIYLANIYLQSNQRCVQLYQLQIYKNLSSEDILIHPNVTHNGTCNVTVTLSCAVIGSDVTVTWNNTNSPGTEVTNHTLRVYNAQSHVTYTCTARNPISEASRTAHIPVICPTEAPVGNDTQQNTRGLRWTSLILIIFLALASVILIITSYLIVRHFHGMKRKSQDPQQLVEL
ncbi:SLAM family member 9-like isoform X1 [Xenopus laevis]|uniref:SLAM family member 9-like isoform X1 n=1 Tax=Xenopus laevis TaxID=8355 RepID=A0A8J1LKD7_XENLA|nr:SLAM family member 9-like isoform X1 [Xenopus laevis]